MRHDERLSVRFTHRMQWCSPTIRKRGTAEFPLETARSSPGPDRAITILKGTYKIRRVKPGLTAFLLDRASAPTADRFRLRQGFGETSPELEER